MRNFHTRCLPALLAGAFLANFGFAQNTLLQADFNDCALPPGWTVNLTGAGAPSWSVTDLPLNGNADSTTIDGSCMVVIDDDAIGQFEPPLTTQFVTPPFDAAANSTVTLSVDVHFREWAQSAFSIYAFDGAQYVLLKRFQGYDDQTGTNFSDHVRFTADLSFYANPQMRLIFEYDDDDDWAWYAGFDNVLVTGSGTATNIILEDFNGCSKPNGWDTQVVTGELDWGFGLFYNDDTDTTSMNGSCFAWFDDDGVDTFLQNAPYSRAMLFTPWMDGTQHAHFYLEFDAILRQAVQEEHIEVGVWDGTNLSIASAYFTDLGGPYFDNYVHLALDLSHFRAPQFRVVFLYDDGNAWGWWTGLDNVKISGEGLINDLCENAFDVFLDQPCLAADNSFALFLGSQPTCVNPLANGGQEVVNALWWRYHAEASGLVKVITRAGFNDVVSVFEGTCGSLSGEVCTNRDEFGFTGETLYFNAVAGQDYLIRVGGLRGSFGSERGEMCLELKPAASVPPTPPNDFCQSAVQLTVSASGGCAAGGNANATFDQPVPSLNENLRADIWYRFTATSSAVEIVSNADFSDVIALYRNGCSNLVEVAANDYGQSLVAIGLVVGQTYRIQISGFFATLEGNVCVQVKPWSEPPPANDLCAEAIPVALGSTCIPLDNLGALYDGPKPSCVAFPYSNVWFKFVAPASGSVKANTGAGFPAVVAVYEGICGSLEELDCFENPLPCDGFFEIGGLAAGETYYLQVATTADIFQNATGGEFCLTLLDGSTGTAEPLELLASIECTGEGVGVLHVGASGGSGSYAFQGSPDGQVLYTGDSWLVVVADGSGCEKSLTGTASCGALTCALTAAVAASPVSCNGFDNGSATVSAQNGNGNLSYLWSNGSTETFITNLQPGFVAVTVTDETGCAYVASATVTESAPLLAGAASTAETGYNANDGAASANPGGGTPPFSFLWSNGSTSQSQSNLPPGAYLVTVTDFNHCQTVQGVTVAEFNCTLSAQVLTQNAACHGANNGAATAVPAGGQLPYAYAWSNGESGSTASNLPPGTVAATVTDGAGCPVVLTASIGEPDVLAANATASGETSAGANDGTAGTSPAGGTPPFSFLWSNGGVAQSLTGLQPSTYTVTVTDGEGCQSVETVVVNAFNCQVGASATDVQDATCFGGSDGQATAAMSGGTAPFSYAWESGGSEATETGLPAGTWTVTVSDAFNCPAVVNVAVGQPPLLFGSVVSQQNVECPGDLTGTATVSASGGVEPHQFFWQNIGAGQTQSGLTNGSYAVAVLDAHGCATTINVSIAVEDNLAPVVSVQNLAVELDENGAATLLADDVDNGSFDNCGIGGRTLAPASFTCADLGENTVALTVTDLNGNSNSAQATVTIVDATVPVLTCPADIFSNDCDSPLDYAPPLATDNCLAGAPALAEGLPSGSVFPEGQTVVSFAVADLAGNSASCSFTVTVSNPLAAGIEIEKPTCHGFADGSATVAAQGGAGGYAYLWDDPQAQATATASSLAAGIYHVTVTDGLGCSFVAEALVPEPPALALDVEAVFPETAPGASDGSIAVAVGGGTLPYLFEWTLGGQVVSTEEDPANLAGGDYLLQVTDANGCVVFSENIEVETLVGAGEAGGLDGLVSVFPNPASGDAEVRVRLPEARRVSFILFDVAGKKIWEAESAPAAEVRQRLDLSALAGGVYQLKITTGGDSAVRKVVVAR